MGHHNSSNIGNGESPVAAWIRQAYPQAFEPDFSLLVQEEGIEPPLHPYQSGGARLNLTEFIKRLGPYGMDQRDDIVSRHGRQPMRKGKLREISWKAMARPRRQDRDFTRAHIMEAWEQDSPPYLDHLDALLALEEAGVWAEAA